MSAEQLARFFHEAYERLAPGFGYATRSDTRAFFPESPNGRLMIAVAGEVLAAMRTSPAPGAPVGFKLVPIKLTEEMLIAGRYVDESNGWELARKMWAAMLDAAPGAPGQEAAEQESDITDAEMVKWLTDNGHDLVESLLAGMEKSK